MQRLRITKSLLDSWLYSFKLNGGYDDFIATLNRQKKQPSEAMLFGVQYENVLNNVLLGETIPSDHEWYKPITEMAEELAGSQQQVTLFKETEVDGQPILLHGVLDYLKAGHIFDCKFSRRYALNKYYWGNTSQTSMYLALVPEAFDFTYIISDGKYVYREKYPRDTILPIEPEIRQFMRFCKEHGLWKIYEEKWRVAN